METIDLVISYKVLLAVILACGIFILIDNKKPPKK
jgi:hypothetical protein